MRTKESLHYEGMDSAVVTGWLQRSAWRAHLWMLVILVLLAQPLPGQAASDDSLPTVLHVAFSSNVFPDIERGDAKLAMELWARELSRRVGIQKAKVTIYEKTDEVRDLIRRGEIHLVTMSSIEYLKYGRRLKILPAYVAANMTGRDAENLLVVRRDSGIRTFRDLRGKTVATVPSTKYDASLLWLNVLLMREGAGKPTGYFRQLTELKKPSQAVMGVFFRRFDSALVSRGSFETCMVMNPQLGTQLIAIAESSSLADTLSCIPNTVNQRLKRAMDTTATSLDKTSVGKQLATLFQVGAIVPFNPSHLSGLEELLRERDSLVAAQGRKR
jgi:ABC-type phosphate/phosphonate transport system substrate-binding protein